MKRLFTSTTIKLTAWYLLIIVVISLLFSVIIFELSTKEISNRLERLQIRAEGSAKTITLPGPLTLTDIRQNQTNQARASIFIGLVYMNLAAIGIGGVISYLLARRSLKPIEAAHEAQSRFTADASHQLRTPLAIMKSEIQVALRDTTMTKKDYKELLESNLEEVDSLSKLSSALLELSRLDYGDILQVERIDIEATLRNASKIFISDSSRLHLTKPNLPIMIDGNQSMIHELFRILYDNAQKYSPPKSLIKTVIKSDGRVCTVTISNTGVGIPKRDIAKVFERFFRSKMPLGERNIQGFGLGLSLAQRITQLHDGSIVARSTPGKTTSFTVKLPHVRKNR